ncbi:MAG: DUF5996 family protein [Anaerolineae bacterium]
MLPPLKGWEATRNSLHRAARVMGLLRKASIGRRPNALHLALFLTTDGLTTERMVDGSRLDFSFAAGELRGVRGNGQAFTLPLADQTAEALLATSARALGRDLAELDPLDDLDASFEVNAAMAADYAQVLNTAFVGLARLRARLLGSMTPMVVWPHGFDLSGLWFMGDTADEQRDPHVNLGFSPGSAGFPRPYLYAYAWPWPEGVESRTLPAPARWTNVGWNGAVLDYDALLGDPDPVGTITHCATAAFNALTGQSL